MCAKPLMGIKGWREEEHLTDSFSVWWSLCFYAPLGCGTAAGGMVQGCKQDNIRRWNILLGTTCRADRIPVLNPQAFLHLLDLKEEQQLAKLNAWIQVLRVQLERYELEYLWGPEEGEKEVDCSLRHEKCTGFESRVRVSWYYVLTDMSVLFLFTFSCLVFL